MAGFGRLAAAALALMLAGEAAAQSVVAARNLRPGTVLAAADMRGAGAEALIAEYAGLEVRRTIYSGRAIRPEDLGPPTLVTRNEIVTLIFQSGGLGLRTEARALGRGAAGERIPVMNLTSRQTVHAIVLAPGIVEVRR